MGVLWISFYPVKTPEKLAPRHDANTHRNRSTSTHTHRVEIKVIGMKGNTVNSIVVQVVKHKTT